jgi:hypothetical protein
VTKTTAGAARSGSPAGLGACEAASDTAPVASAATQSTPTLLVAGAVAGAALGRSARPIPTASPPMSPGAATTKGMGDCFGGGESG